MKDHSENTDEELLKQYHLERNPQLLNILLFRYSDVGFRTAMRYMRNQSDAEDVLQLAFIQFLQSLHLFREGAVTVKPWLMKMIVNTSIDKLREEKRRSKRQNNVASERFQEQQQLSEEQIPTDKEELKKKIRGFVDTLPEKYRSPIWLVLYEGFSYPEVASVLELPEKTIRTQVARGLERLRQILGPFGSSLSVVFISELITTSKLEVAPKSVNEIINSPELYKSVSTKSRRIAITKTKAPFFTNAKTLFFGLITIMAIVGFYFWKINPKEALKQIVKVENKPILLTLKENKPFHLSLDFNQSNKKIPYSYSGESKYLENGGLAGSGSMVFPKDFVMKIPIEKNQLPLKITFRANIKVENSFDESIYLSIMWDGWERMGRFYDLGGGLAFNYKKSGDYMVSQDKDWLYQTIWVTEISLDNWINEKRVVLDIVDQKASNNNLFIKFTKYYKIDNLVIESVDQSQLPDISKFIKINDEVFKETLEEETNILKYLPENKNYKITPTHQKFKKASENEVIDLLSNSKPSKK